MDKENTFEILGKDVVNVLEQSKLNGKEPTLIQEMAIRPILDGENTMVISETGSGKTLAVMLPLLSKMAKNREKPISCLYITPLKSLNRDLLDRLIWWANKLELDIAVRHGDTTPYRRRQQAEFPPHIMIVTLETLQPIITGKKMRKHLSNIEYVVIDEVHETVESKRGIQLSLGLERLKKLCSGFQLVMLSATVGSPQNVANFFSAGKDVRIVRAETAKAYDIKVINPEPVAADSEIAKRIFSTEETAARLRTIMELIKDSRSSLTFTNTREFAEILSTRTKAVEKDFPAEIHHSSLSKSVRIDTEEKFREEEIKSIICVSGDTSILLGDGSWGTIKDLPKGNLKITSLNDNLKLEKDETPTIVENGRKKTLKVVTKTGFEIECTEDHRFLTIRNGKLEWVKAKEMETGQYVAMIRRNPFNPSEKEFHSIVPDSVHARISDELFKKIKKNVKEKYGKYKTFSQKTGIKSSRLRHFLASNDTNQPIKRLKKIVKNMDISNEELYSEIELVGSRNYTRYKMPEKISPKFCRLLGFILSDGTITRKNRIRLFNKDRKLLMKYKKILKDEFDIDGRILNAENCLVLQTHASWLCKVMKNIGIKLGRKARIIEMPEIILQLPKKHQINFLSGYFDGDGCFQNYNGRTYSILFTTFSKKMAQDINFLLLSLGMISSIRHTDKKDSYTVGLMGGKNLRKFVKISEIWKDKSTLNIMGKGYCHRDTIPSMGSILKNIRIDAGMSTYSMRMGNGINPYRYETNKRSISRRNLSNLTEIYSEKGESKKILDNLSKSDIFWAEILEIKPSKTREVFDVIDTKNSNFVANGFITHNCTSSLQLGIDIGSIDLVIQYMSPRRVSQLVQRVGRAGHGMDKVSKGVVIATDEDDCFEASVVARRALNGEIEPTNSHTKSLDVLAHQIVGMTIENWKLDIEETYNMVTKSWPYRNLEYHEFMDVVKQLKKLGLVFVDEKIGKKRRGYKYYFGNLSTIPSTKQYRIYNMISRSFVGVLDDEFVAMHGNPGTTFIVKGEPWEIVEVEDDKVMVEPSGDAEAAVPGWEGEMIPVHFDIAQEVGKLRRDIAESLKDGGKKAMEKLMDEYPVDENVAKKMIRFMKEQLKHDSENIPDDKTIVIEQYEDIAVLNSCFGSIVNDTLGRFLAALLTSRLGSVGLKTDSYRIMIQFQKKNMDVVEEILMETDPDHMESYLDMSLTKSEMFIWKFVHVAKRFGAFAPTVQFGKTKLKNIVGDYVNTPVYKETLSEIKTEKLDIDKAVEILRKIQSGEIKLVFKKDISPIGKMGIKHKYSEIIGPERPAKEILEALKKRIMGNKTRLVCMNCAEWTRQFVIEDMPEEVKCPECGAISLGIVYYGARDADKIIEKAMNNKKLTPDEKKIYKRAKETLELYITYKKNAAIVLAGRGVGPQTAKRILSRYHETVDDLMNNIMKAERQFMKTKKYWSV